MVSLAAADVGHQLLQPVGQTLHPALRLLGQHLGGGQNAHFGAVFRSSLGVDVKKPHGVHFVAEKLHPDGVPLGRGEEIQNAAPQGKLAHALHLLTPAVSGGHQNFCQFLQIVAFSDAQGAAGLPQILRRHGPLEQSFHSGHQNGAFFIQKVLKQGQPLMFPRAGRRCRLMKGELPGGEHRRFLPGEAPQIGRHTAALPLVGAEHHQGPSAVLFQSGGHIGPVHR